MDGMPPKFPEFATKASEHPPMFTPYDDRSYFPVPFEAKVELPKRELPQWEYKTVGFTGEFSDLGNFVDMLNALGEQGWQVCARFGVQIDSTFLLIREVLPTAVDSAGDRSEVTNGNTE